MCRWLLPEPVPVFGNDDGIARVGRIVLDGGHEPRAAGVQVDAMTQAGYILRGFVTDARDVVLIDEELHLRRTGRKGKFVHVDHCAVCDAADLADAETALLLDLIRGLAMAAFPGPQRHGGAHGDNDEQGIRRDGFVHGQLAERPVIDFPTDEFTTPPVASKSAGNLNPEYWAHLLVFNLGRVCPKRI